MSFELPAGRYAFDYENSDCECDTVNPPVIVVTETEIYGECQSCGNVVDVQPEE